MIDAPTTSDSTLLKDRVLLRRGIEEGIEPPEELEPGILLRGKVHHLFSGSGMGKTFFSLWAAKRCVEREERVLYFDNENGPRIVSERLRILDVDTSLVNEYLYYIPSLSLTMGRGDPEGYVALLDEVDPALVIFDSWVNFLAGAGMDENSNTDIVRWAVRYTHPARNRGITVLLLDHMPHDGNRARGATRKKDEVDVQWKLHRPQPFDRSKVGEVGLFREKDREGWLPPSVMFKVGSTPDGFVFVRQGATPQARGDDLTENQRKVLEAVVGFGKSGARYTEVAGASGVKDSTLDRALKLLCNIGLVQKAGKRYYLASNPHEPPSDPRRGNGGGKDNPHRPHPPIDGGGGGTPDGGDKRKGADSPTHSRATAIKELSDRGLASPPNTPSGRAQPAVLHEVQDKDNYARGDEIETALRQYVTGNPSILSENPSTVAWLLNEQEFPSFRVTEFEVEPVIKQLRGEELKAHHGDPGAPGEIG